MFERGRVSGIVRFRGERGFTKIRSRGGRATVTRSFRKVCKRFKGEGKLPEIPLRTTGVAVAPASGRSGPSFSVSNLALAELPPLPGFDFMATLSERRGRISISRSVKTSTDGGGFSLSPKGVVPATATVEPPAPFSGSATFSKVPGEPASWTGDLSARFPGRGEVRLAGPSFTARLCRNAPLFCNSSAVPFGDLVPLSSRPGPGAQISGSQSQPPGVARLSWSR